MGELGATVMVYPPGCVTLPVAIFGLTERFNATNCITPARASGEDVRELKGSQVGIPFGGAIHCPVRALDNWITVASIEDGPVFRPVESTRASLL